MEPLGHKLSGFGFRVIIGFRVEPFAFVVKGFRFRVWRFAFGG